MALPIKNMEERESQESGIKGVIFGKSGIGKTSLLWTLPAESTLFVDLEAGDLAIKGWTGDSMQINSWVECRHLAVYLGGPKRLTLKEDSPYSNAHYKAVCEKYGDRACLDKYKTIFIDSITVAGRLCFEWSKAQCMEKGGKVDTRAAYGLHGQEMMTWLSHLQHVRSKNIWFMGILDEKLDDYSRRYYAPQIEGSKTGLELPGIVDQVITMAEIRPEASEPYRAFVCRTINDWGYPAKDRSGKLEMIEPAHLGKLMEKIKLGERNF